MSDIRIFIMIKNVNKIIYKNHKTITKVKYDENNSIRILKTIAYQNCKLFIRPNQLVYNKGKNLTGFENNLQLYNHIV